MQAGRIPRADTRFATAARFPGACRPIDQIFPQLFPKGTDMNAPEKILYTAHAAATGGRDGQIVSSDQVLQAKLTTPKELGGADAVGTNPQQFFATGD